MENPTKVRKATLRTMITIAATSMVESRFAMRQYFRHSNDGIDLDHAAPAVPLHSTASRSRSRAVNAARP
jgi:hypothetical protein